MAVNKRAKATIGDVLRCVELIGDEMRLIHEKLAKLEAQGAFDYCGVHQTGRAYKRNQGVTQNGSIWIAVKDYPAAPGAPDSGWILACKRGRDGRPAK